MGSAAHLLHTVSIWNVPRQDGRQYKNQSYRPAD